MDKLQTIMNNSIRFVMGMGKRTKTRILMESANWLDIHELEELHSLMLMWKVVRLNSPQYMADRIEINEENLISTQYPRLQNSLRGFRWKSTAQWNNMDPELREELSLPRFKKNVRRWIVNRRPPNQNIEQQ